MKKGICASLQWARQYRDLISKINLVLSEQDELIVVNDGSSDNTETEIDNSKCIKINLTQNMEKDMHV